MNSLRLRFANQDQPDLVLGPGVHGIGRDADGTLVPASSAAATLAQLCVDRRGVWLKLDPRTRAVHVNGRPVRQMAMLRVGDAIYLEGGELLLLGESDGRTVRLPPAGNSAGQEGDPRVVLRGVGGQYYGRSFTLERPRLVGRGSECDIRIDDQAFAERHARLELHDGQVLLRDLGSADGSVVNGEPVRDAVLRPGDQLVFDAHQRFVLEAPGRPANIHEAPPDTLDEAATPEANLRAATLPHNARRLPWLLLAALLIAAGLSALLLFGSSS